MGQRLGAAVEPGLEPVPKASDFGALMPIMVFRRKVHGLKHGLYR